MRRLLSILAIPLLALLAACSTAAEGPQGPDPRLVKPAAVDVIAMSDDFAFTFMPGETIADVEWDVEIDYDTRDVQAVYDFYHAELTAAGFTRTDIEAEDNEVEADYTHTTTGLEIEIEVERDDGWVQVDLDIDDFTGPFAPGFSLTSFGGFDLPIYGGAEVADVEWDFNFDHPSTNTQEVFDYYDGHLQDLGWTQTELDDGDDDELEAEYENDGVHLELEVEDNSEVELEFNKLRFY